MPRLQFADFDPAPEYADGWADVLARRPFGVRLEVNEAASTGLRAYNLKRIALYVTNWSLGTAPTDETFVAAQDDDLMTWILNQAEALFEEVRRDRVERKSDRARATGQLRSDGDRPRDHLAGERPAA